ncbi:MAG TPA: hypothetical protein VI011_16470, partial [Asanoa sp.]
MDDNTRQGVKLLTTAAVQRRDTSALDAIDAFVNDQRQRLRQLATGRDGTEGSRVAASDGLLDTVGRRSADLRDSLACAPDAQPQTDQFGPVPNACAMGRPG